MILARLGKRIFSSSNRLLFTLALMPLMGFSLGPTPVAHDDSETLGKTLVADAQRGRVLYETYCIACHTTQAHWRDKHIVRSWADLLYQVTRMEKNAGQDWSAAEISDVANYLNDTFYKMRCPPEGCGGPEARAPERPEFARACGWRIPSQAAIGV